MKKIFKEKKIQACTFKSDRSSHLCFFGSSLLTLKCDELVQRVMQ